MLPLPEIRWRSVSRPCLAPKVLVDDLLDWISLPRSVGIHYAGGVEHLLKSKEIALRLGLRGAPDFVWDPRALYDSDGIRRVIESLPLSRVNGDGLDGIDAVIRGRIPALVAATIFGVAQTSKAVLSTARPWSEQGV